MPQHKKADALTGHGTGCDFGIGLSGFVDGIQTLFELRGR